MEKFELNLTHEELEKRTHKDYLAPKVMLKPDSKEFTELLDGDKEALKYLVKAANILDDVYMQMDNAKNLAFREFLRKKIEAGNEDAKLTLKLYTAQRGMNALDTESNFIMLAKNQKNLAGKGFYPQDMEREEFHNILIKMLKEGKINEVKNILNQRTIVERNGDELKGVDYTEKFKTEFHKVADELEKAARVSTNKDFNEYLILQAKALRENDVMLDAYADKKWATLQDTPLEFTISREQYSDRLTGTVMENDELSKLLEENHIEAISKDSIGVRVGIINKKGTEDLLKIKKYLPELAKKMPYSDKYTQTISSDGEVNQTMVDVDLVTVTGDEGAYRGGITLAQNLPNGDKMSLQIGGGRRNVYHRQIRVSSQPEKIQKRLDAILDKKFHALYCEEADHWFTIGHENAHSLGPKEGVEKLGKYYNIIEENKADMGSLAFVDDLVEMGMYTDEQRKQIIVNFATGLFLKSKPTLDQAHRVRTVMQSHYFMQEGAIDVNNDSKIEICIDKMVDTAKKMLADTVKIQMSKDVKIAQKYVEDNFVWDDKMETIACALKKVAKTLNGIVETPLADELIK